MYRHTETFIRFCRDNFNIELGALRNTSGYQSLSACILDCVYSLRAKYFSTTVPVVERYAETYMGNNRFAAGNTVNDFIANIDSVGTDSFASDILKNKQLSGGVLKSEVCYQLAKYLRYLHINTMDDFKNFECPELLEIVIHSVKGMGDAGTNYMFMLAGDPNRCKPDVHVHHCIQEDVLYFLFVYRNFLISINKHVSGFGYLQWGIHFIIHKTKFFGKFVPCIKTRIPAVFKTCLFVFLWRMIDNSGKFQVCILIFFILKFFMQTGDSFLIFCFIQLFIQYTFYNFCN